MGHTNTEPSRGRQLGDRVSGFLENNSLLLSLFGGRISDVLRSPLFQEGQRRRAGRELTESLREHTPEFGRASATRPQVTGPGIPDISLPEIGAQAFEERRDVLTQLQEQQTEQREVLANFRESMGDAFSGLDQIDGILASVGQQNNQQFAEGLKSINKLRKDTLGFIAAGLRNSAKMLADIKAGNTEVLERIDLEVAQRAEQLSSGIAARTNALFNETMRAMDSVSPLAPEERVALQAMFQMQGASDTATAMGQLHAGVAEFRARVDSDLQSGLATAQSFAIQSGTGLISTGIAAFEAASAQATTLRTNFVNQQRLIATTRAEMKQVGAQLKMQTGGVIFDMVSQMARPVAIFSDIMADLFDMSFDVLAFNNTVEQQELLNEIVIARPEFEAVFLAIAGLEQAARAKDQRDFQSGIASQNRTTSLIGAGVGAFGQLGAAGIGARGATDAATIAAGA